ncbi:hypothetical protein [Metabacillus fastidiosus]|uniref:hypothetical protein n=1 Tax=Metabacillus fastidiosus TaxID=1458 RepID=UPI002E238767|nr:hypothetical protein [Metabacillus fastidiosus]
MKGATKVTSYKLTLKVKRLLEKYSSNLKTSKAKLINYGLFEVFVKNKEKIGPDIIAEYINSTKLILKKDTYTFHILEEYYNQITNLKEEVEKINNTKYHDNEFLGIILSFYFDKIAFLRKKKVIEQLEEDEKPSQIGLYLNIKLKKRINELCEKYQLNAGTLFFDVLSDISSKNFPFHSFPKNIYIESEEKERIIIYLPKYIHNELNENPLSNSFIAEIRAEQFFKKFNIT